MRVLAALSGLVVVFALAAGITVAHLHAGSPSSLTASTRPAAVVSSSGYDIPDPASHTMPRPRSTPTPPPSNPPAASKSGPVAAVPAPRPAAPPRIVVMTTQQALINQDRARHGLGALTWNSCLYNVALANARRMAAAEVMSHANGVYQDLACGIGHQSGENVGYYSLGANDSLLNTDFMNSPEHRANILGPYRYVATAWAIGANGYGYIAVEFD